MPVEKAPVICIENKYIDYLISNSGGSLPENLAVMIIIDRFKIYDAKEISEILNRPVIQIECAMIELIASGFLIKN